MNRPRKSQRHLPPCVYEKHGAFWLVKGGQWRRLGTALGEALAAYAQTIDAPGSGMASLIERAFAVHAPKVAQSTRAQYRTAADILKRKLAEFSPGQVKAKHVSALIDTLADTPNMANRVRSFLSTVFNYAVKWQEVDSNPCIGLPRLPESKRTRLLSDDEWSAIHAAAGPRLRVIMELQYLTGQRISDVLSIRRSQITDEGLAFEQQKTGARLVVRWSRDLRATLAAAEALSAGKPPALTLLRGRYNGAPDYRSVLLQWNEACKAAGVEDARFNDGRARAATAADAQGQDAQALLGHTTAAHTARYLRDHKPAEVRGPKIRRR